MKNFITITNENIWNLIEKYGPLTLKYNKIDKIKVDPKFFDKTSKIEAHRWELFRRHFAYTFPTKEMIDKMVEFIGNDGVIEVGAGKGLHAYLLQLKGVNIITTDDYSWATPQNGYAFMNIEKLSHLDSIKKYNDKNVLLLIWPPFDNPMAYDTLKTFKGNKFIFIGEEEGGATGDDKFHKLLKKEWYLKDTVEIPQFIMAFDKVYMYDMK